MSEAYVLLNVNHKNQASIIDQVKSLAGVKAVKSVYGIYDILVIFESDDLQQIKNEIDNNLHSIGGIENLTTLISVA
ncbi:MAG: Lrp/AsnC ligand binding domain-containing protein [Candidatus Nitrosocosmicus sp.]|uniref:Lrp/AsnC ligand binding domain-containing protein n=1 Tax=Candidatus Nitrosocosmicus agrestis TaxID=2563600 RepID=UPI0013311CB4|nr:Lrp/AsnC ligand binding domain-containing protein [Candidatus Nitrosocosmicus sp. SS]